MDYFPRFLMSTRPPGDDVYELLVTGRDAVGVLSKITSVLSRNNVNFVSNHGQVDESGKVFVDAFFCDMGKAKVKPDELKRQLEGLPFVTEVRLESMKGMMYEKFMFPMSFLFADRTLKLGARAFTQMEGRLVEIFGSAGETMAYEQGRAYARSTFDDLEEYRVKVGAAWDLPNIEGLFRGQGWGIVTVGESPEGFQVSVRSPPKNGEQGAAGGPGRFLVGMIVGTLERYAGGHLAAGPVSYDAQGEAWLMPVRRVRHG